MTRKKALLITLTFLFAITAIRVGWIYVQLPPDHPVAVQGELDLRTWDFSANKAITLNGEWAYYPQVLLMDKEANRSSSHLVPAYVQTPGKLPDTSDILNDHALNSENEWTHYGSYRLRVKIDPVELESYGLYLPVIPTAYELFINGERLATSGQPATQLDQVSGGFTPSTAFFNTEEADLDIIIHVANHDRSAPSGIARSIKFGSQAALSYEVNFHRNMQWLVCFVLLFHAIYITVLLFMNRREQGLFIFLLLTLSVMLMTLVDDDRLLMQSLPFNYEWNVKVRMLAYMLCAMTMYQFTRVLLDRAFAKRFSRIVFAVFTILFITTLFIPEHYISFIPYQLFMLTPIAMAFTLVIRAVWQRQEDAIYFLLGIVIIAVNVIWGNINQFNILEMNYYPLDLIFAFIVFVSFWFKHYFRTAEQARQLAKRLQSEDRLKDDFLVNTSHELRNPLHGMLNIAQSIIEQDNDIDEPTRHKAKLIKTIGQHMSYLLNDLLDASRLKHNELQLQVQSLRIDNTVLGVFDMIRPMMAGKPIRLIHRIPDAFPNVLADETRLIQILFNLVHNAVKFTDEGHIAVEAKIINNKAYISVQDTGIGIEQHKQQQLFQPYFQSDRSITISSGIGLGLTVSKQLVELHGGKLTVKSVRGEGTTFTFSLNVDTKAAIVEDTKPVVQERLTTAYHDEIATAATAFHEHHERNPYVLVVDDDPINLTVLSNILEAEPFNVETVTSGQDALKLLDQREWDLIISDVMMPHMSGYELSRSIRERFTRAELPILLLTARNRPEDIEAGFLSGANDYVTKPTEAMALRARVHALTALKRTVAEKSRMEAAWLQAQIQPHFLFNTLNTIAALSNIDNEKMLELFEMFGKYLKASFDFKNLDRLVPLKHELELVRSYLYIETVRFEDRIKIVWDIDESCMDIDVPPLSIQPLVENAIRHGILKRPEGGQVTITINEDREGVKVCVKDNGVGMSEDVRLHLAAKPLYAGPGIGIINTDRRLKQLYGTGLHIESYPNEGTAISFSILKGTSFK